jgi:HK97 family phage major capsid protein
MSKKLRRAKISRRSSRGNLPVLQEERVELLKNVHRMRDLLRERRDQSKTNADIIPEFTSIEEDEWQKINHRLDSVDQQIEVERVAQKYDAKLDAVDPDDYQIGRDDYVPGKSKRGRKDDHERQLSDDLCRAAALQAWCRHAAGLPLTKDHRRSCRQIGFNPAARGFSGALSGTENFRELQELFAIHGRARSVRAALANDRQSRMLTSIGPAQQGPALVGETYINNLEIAILETSNLMQVADVMDTDGGEPMHWPTADDTANEGQIVGEGKSLGTATDPTFGRQTWGAFKYTSKPILVTHELMEDSYINFLSVIPQMQGQRLGRVYTRHLTTGNGATEPEGFMTSAALGATTAGATAILLPEIVELIDSLDDHYLPNASFQMNKAIMTYLRKKVDADGRPILQESWKEGIPATLLGYRIGFNSAMDSTVATTKKTIAFGDFSKLKVRRVRGVRNLRLNEKYVVEYDAIAFVSLMRLDGKVLGSNFPAARKPIKYLLQA